VQAPSNYAAAAALLQQAAAAGERWLSAMTYMA